jgi:hypothetical protein
VSEVGAIAARLREIVARLRDPELPDAEAEALAREAAELVARAANEIERTDQGPGGAES